MNYLEKLKPLQFAEMYDLLSPKPYKTQRRKEIRVRAWEELKQMVA